MAMSLKQEILSTDPLAKVGEVTAVMPQDSTVAVQGINPNDVREGDALLVVGGKMNPVARATVYRIDRDRNVLVLKYQDVTDPRRPPDTGDLAVRMSDHPLPPGAHVTVPSGESAMPPVNTPPPVNNVPPPAPVTQPTAPTGGADNKPADSTAPTSDKKPEPTDTATQTPATGSTNPTTGTGDAAKDAPAKPSDFNK